MQAPFITFEGGEGSGKSTQIKLLEQFLTNKGIKALITKEPGGTELGLQLRRLLVEGDADKMDAYAEALLFFADRRIHLTQKIWPALKENKWVISDRFADSTMAYQYYAYNQRLSKENIKMLYDFAVGQFEPNLTFILDIDPKIGLARSFQKAATMTVQETRNENRVLQWHENLRYGYLQIAKENPLRCVVLDADTDIETLHQQIVKVLHERFEI